MLNLQRMSLFIAVVNSGSFTAAAAASGQCIDSLEVRH